MVRLLSVACGGDAGSEASGEASANRTAPNSVRDSSLDITCILLSLSI